MWYTVLEFKWSRCNDRLYTKIVGLALRWLYLNLENLRRRMFATNRFVTSACSGQSVTSRLRSITSWHMFVTVYVWSRTYFPKSSRHEVTFHRKLQLLLKIQEVLATSMLVTDVGNEMCWRQLRDVGDGFGRFRHQHPLSFHIANVTLTSDANIQKMSPIWKSHQNPLVIN